MRRRTVRTLTALAALPLALTTACSSSKPSSQARDEVTPGPSAPAATQAGTPTATRSTAPASPAGSTADATTGTTTQAPVSQPLATNAPGRPAASKATPAGGYTYDVSGSVTYGGAKQPADGTASLTVSAVKDGSQSSTLHGDNGDTVQQVLVRDAGSYLTSLHLTTPAFDKEFRPSPAALLFPDPAKVGASWSWQATSTDGASTVKASQKVLRTETLTIGGKAVPTVVLQSRVIISGDVDYTVDVTSWVVPSLRLPVKDHSVGKGSVGGVKVTSDTTSVMRSVTPA